MKKTLMPEAATKKRGRPTRGEPVSGYQMYISADLMNWIRQEAQAEGRTIRAFIVRILQAEKRRREEKIE